jgi:hypothetical protein
VCGKAVKLVVANGTVVTVGEDQPDLLNAARCADSGIVLRR